MKTFKNIVDIQSALLRSAAEESGGIRVRAVDMGSGSHRYWLTGDAENYRIHCFGSGAGWSDQGDDCRTQDVTKLAKYLWQHRADILE